MDPFLNYATGQMNRMQSNPHWVVRSRSFFAFVRAAFITSYFIIYKSSAASASLHMAILYYCCRFYFIFSMSLILMVTRNISIQRPRIDMRFSGGGKEYKNTYFLMVFNFFFIFYYAHAQYNLHFFK